MNALRWRGWLVAAMVFVLGVAVGAAGTVWLGTRAIRRVLQAPLSATGPADRAVARIGADLTRSLELTPDQSERVQVILEQSAVRMKAIRAGALLRAGAELRTTTDRIAAELPPEKHEELYRVIARRYERLGLRPPEPPVKDQTERTP